MKPFANLSMKTQKRNQNQHTKVVVAVVVIDYCCYVLLVLLFLLLPLLLLLFSLLKYLGKIEKTKQSLPTPGLSLFLSYA